MNRAVRFGRHQRVGENHARLAEPAKKHDVTLFGAHDPVELERMRTAGGKLQALYAQSA